MRKTVLDLGSTSKNTVRVLGNTHILMERSMKGSGRMGNNIVKGHSLLLMEENGQVSSEGINLGTSRHTTKTETSYG